MEAESRWRTVLVHVERHIRTYSRSLAVLVFHVCEDIGKPPAVSNVHQHHVLTLRCGGGGWNRRKTS